MQSGSSFHFALFLNMGDNTENLQYSFTAMVQEREINCYQIPVPSACTLQTNKSERPGVEARNRTLFRKPADQEDCRLMSQNNHLIGVWMTRSFIEQRWGQGRR